MIWLAAWWLSNSAISKWRRQEVFLKPRSIFLADAFGEGAIFRAAVLLTIKNGRQDNFTAERIYVHKHDTHTAAEFGCSMQFSWGWLTRKLILRNSYSFTFDSDPNSVKPHDTDRYGIHREHGKQVIMILVRFSKSRKASEDDLPENILWQI